MFMALVREPLLISPFYSPPTRSWVKECKEKGKKGSWSSSPTHAARHCLKWEPKKKKDEEEEEYKGENPPLRKKKRKSLYSTLPLYSPSDLYRKFSLWNHRPILSLSLSLYPHIIWLETAVRIDDYSFAVRSCRACTFNTWYFLKKKKASSIPFWLGGEFGIGGIVEVTGIPRKWLVLWGSARRGQTFIRHARTHQPHITRANERIGFLSSSWRMRACGDYLRVLFGKTKTTTIAPSTNTISGRRKERSIVTLHTKVDGLGGEGKETNPFGAQKTTTYSRHMDCRIVGFYHLKWKVKRGFTLSSRWTWKETGSHEIGGGGGNPIRYIFVDFLQRLRKCTHQENVAQSESNDVIWYLQGVATAKLNCRSLGHQR